MLEMPQLSLIIAKKQQAQNSNFFYAIQFDDVGHMVHFFFFLGGCVIKNGLSILWGCSDI